MKHFHLLSVIFILCYLGGLIESLGLNSLTVNFIQELPIYILVFYTMIRSRSFRTPGWMFIVFFVIWVVISGLNSGDGLYSSILYSRMLLYAFLIFWATWNADLTRRDIASLNKLILSLWILQIAAALFYVFLLDQRFERIVGTLSSSGGGTGTIFPMFAMSYVIASYLYQKRSLFWIFLGFSFGFVGYANSKRAVYYYLPLLLVIMLGLYLFREKHPKRKSILLILIVFMILIPILLIGVNNSAGISTENEESSISDILDHMITYAFKYENREYGNSTSGRYSTSKFMLSEVLKFSDTKFLFGYGPASIAHKEGEVRSDIGIIYGETGFVKETLSVGWPAMLTHIGLYLYLWLLLYQRRKLMQNPEAKAIYFGTQMAFFVFLLIYTTYMDAFSMAGWFTYIHFYFLALLLSPKHKWLLLPIEGKKKY
jgi:hypothetical protein